MTLKVYCGHQEYLSHARAAADYRLILQQLCTVVDNPADADVALLHHEPSEYPRLLEELPALLNKYVIGYCVWEANRVPERFVGCMRLMDELWTASAYCHQVFAPVHPRVTWMPHVVRPEATCDASDVHTMAQQLRLPDGACTFLHITTEGIKRKNTRGLIQAFDYVYRRRPEARLLIKTIQYPSFSLTPPTFTRRGAVVTVNGRLPENHLAALYELSQVLVSPHFAEGWGLTLSDAMALGVPVVATAYSGNMDFMTPYNSLWVNCTEQPIARDDSYYYFRPPMRWAQPHRESLERQMLLALDMVQDGSMAKVTEQARRDIALFDAEHVARWMAQRLSQIETGLLHGSLRPTARLRRHHAG